jgi:hypothetical protein
VRDAVRADGGDDPVVGRALAYPRAPSRTTASTFPDAGGGEVVAGAVDEIAVDEIVVDVEAGRVSVFAGEVGQEGGVVAGARAEFQDQVARLHVELVEHGGDHGGLRGTRDRRAAGVVLDVHRRVGVGLGQRRVGDEEVARHRPRPDLLPRMREIIGRVEAGLERGEVPFVGNMATQIAVAALIEEGEVVEDLAQEDAERWTWCLALDADDMKLWDLSDVLLPDLDHEFLFDPRYDGIENDDLMVNFMRTPNLHPRRWFEPFYENLPSSL